jgi:hypothetical protein
MKAGGFLKVPKGMQADELVSMEVRIGIGGLGRDCLSNQRQDQHLGIHDQLDLNRPQPLLEKRGTVSMVS